MKRMYAFAIVGALTGSMAAFPAVAQQQWGQQQSQVPNRAVEPQFLAEIQQGLQQQGYYRGQVDGIYGPLTHEAISGWQRDQGLLPTGQLNSRTVASMMDPGRQQAAAQPMMQEAEPAMPGFGAVEQMAETPRTGQIDRLRTDSMSSPNIVGEAVPERPGTGVPAPQASREELLDPQFR